MLAQPRTPFHFLDCDGFEHPRFRTCWDHCSVPCVSCTRLYIVVVMLFVIVHSAGFLISPSGEGKESICIFAFPEAANLLACRSNGLVCYSLQ